MPTGSHAHPSHISIDSSDHRRETAIGNAFTVFLALLIYEGVLRKFLLPWFSSPLIFLKVLPVLYIYYLSYFGRPLSIPPIANLAFTSAALTYGILAVIVPIVYYDFKYYLLTVQAYINYFLYAPLIVVMPHYVTRALINKIIALLIYSFVFNSILSIAQFYAPRDAFINSGVEVDGKSFSAFNAVGETVRPPGLFAASQGNAMFMGLIYQIVLGLALSSRMRVLKTPSLVMLLALYLVCVSVSGTRGLVATTISTLVFLIPFVAWSSDKITIRVYGAVVALMLMITAAIVLLFPTGVDLLLERFAQASAAEDGDEDLKYGAFGRVVRSLYGFTDYIGTTPPFGYVLGISSNAAKQLPWVALPKEASAWGGYGSWATETTWADHIVDVGLPLAILYIAFRVLVALYLLQWARASFFHAGSAVGASIFAGSAYLLVFGQISTNNNVGPILWTSIAIAGCFCSQAITEQSNR